MHNGLVRALESVVADDSVPKTFVVVEARGLRSTNATRPGDLVTIEFYFFAMHLIIDG
jgi:hypothetical protein